MISFRNSIKQKYTLITVLTMLSFLIILLISIYNLTMHYSLAGMEELATMMLNDTDDKINRFFKEIEFLTRSLANYKAVYNLEVDHLKDLFLSIVLTRQEYMRSIYLGTKVGKMYEWGVGDGFTDFLPTFPPDYNPVKRPWYQSAVAKKGHTIIGPYVYASVPALGITSVIPVFDKQKVFVGVLGIDIMLDGLGAMLKGIKLQKGGNALLLSPEGKVLASQSGFESGNPLFLHKFYPDLLDQFKGSEQGFYVFPADSGKTYFSYKKNEFTGWFLVIGFPYNTLLAGPQRIFEIVTIIDIILILILVTILILLTSTIVIRPVADIISVIKRLEQGEGEARVKIKSRDEFSLLGKQFNNLLDTVEDYSKGMEEKVRHRTKKIIRLQEENNRLKLIKEKEKIYANLHDSIGARLTNINVCNHVAKTLLKNNQEKLKEMITFIGSNCQSAIYDLKDIILQRDGFNIPKNDFKDFLEKVIRKRLALKDIRFSLESGGLDWISEIDQEIRFELKNILRELVSNVLKHSRAREVVLYIKRLEGKVVFQFIDNGKGFVMGHKMGGSFGLTNIFKRAEDLRGTVSVETSPGQGAAFHIEVPIYNNEESQE